MAEEALKECETQFYNYLPLALATIAQTMQAVVYVLAQGDVKAKPDRLAEYLRGWGLPFFADAIEGEAKEAEALQMFDAVKRLKERQK